MDINDQVLIELELHGDYDPQRELGIIQSKTCPLSIPTVFAPDVFSLDPEWEEHEKEYTEIRRTILGEDESDEDSEAGSEADEDEDEVCQRAFCASLFS